LLLSAFAGSASSDDTLFHVYSRAAPQSVISRSFAGAGSAAPHDIFQGLANPALTVVKIGTAGAYEAGYGRDSVFNKLALPFGAVFFEENSALGVFYRYLDGDGGTIHDAVINFAGRLFERAEDDGPGPVEFGMNVRYENSDWRHAVPEPAANGEDGDGGGPEYAAGAVRARGNGLLLDIGFYQRYLPGFDFALVFSNIAGYRWSEADGRGKSEGWINGRHRSVTAGMLCSLPIANSFLLRIPIDLEAADAFSARPVYMIRAGAELRIAQMYSARFGYARAPEDPAELVKTFNYDNLFFGGVGVAVKGFLLDVFAGKREFGASVTYGY